jgi:hypothetical protein
MKRQKPPWEFQDGFVLLGNCPLLIVNLLVPLAAAAESAAAATPAVASAAAPAATFFAWPSFIDDKLAATDILIVQAFDGRLSFLRTVHFDEAETFRPSRIAIHNDLRRFDRPKRCEHGLQIGIAHAIREITDIQLLRHGGPPSKKITRSSATPAA